MSAKTVNGLRMVYCVVCLAKGDRPEVVHIFSSAERAQAFADADYERDHVLYDYVVDFPERMEQAVG